MPELGKNSETDDGIGTNGGKPEREILIGILMFIMNFLPLASIVLLISYKGQDIKHYRLSTVEVDSQVTIANEVGMVVTSIQIERSTFALFLLKNDHFFRRNLTERFAITDRALRELSTWPQIDIRTPEGVGRKINSRKSFMKIMKNFRENILSKAETSDALHCYNSVNAALLDHLMDKIKETSETRVWRYVIVFMNLLKSIEFMGISMIRGISYFIEGHVHPQNYRNFVKETVLGQDLLSTSFNYWPHLRTLYLNHRIEVERYEHIKYYQDKIMTNEYQSSSVEDAKKYLDLMTWHVDELRKLQKAVSIQIRDNVNSDVREANLRQSILLTMLLFFIVLVPINLLFFLYILAKNQDHKTNLAEMSRKLKCEKRRSYSRLCQMLPPSVAERLKNTSVPTTLYEQVTVYFGKIVGFSEIEAKSSPLEVVRFLNRVNKLFDAIIQKYDAYKVETFLDTFIVASGLPVTNGQRHLSEIATMALELKAASSLIVTPHTERLQIRSGIHTGPVVACIVGNKAPRYCILGNTVNIASKLESTGAASKIHISSEMKSAMEEVGGFATKHGGFITIEGKGVCGTHWLLRKLASTKIDVSDLSYVIKNDDPLYMRNIRL